MLTELQVRDLALIEHVSLGFGTGLNAITGETGAGKSLLVGALELLLGERPRPNLVRSGAKHAQVEARFAIARDESGEAIARWIAANLPAVAEDWAELETSDERELILSRSVSTDGKTRAHVNGRGVTLKQLAELAPRVFEIHGQNDHQRLLEPTEQLHLLDLFGGLAKELASYRTARSAWLELVERALDLEASERDRRDRLDLARFQSTEIAAAKPDAAERAELSNERELLRHGDELKTVFGGLVEELVEADHALLSRLQAAEKTVRAWRDRVASLAAAGDDLATSLAHLESAASELRSIADKVEVDPRRLEAIEERLAELERLEKKYSTDTAGLAARALELERENAKLESEEKSLAGLGDEIARARATTLERGLALRRSRTALCEKLVGSVQRALKSLGLERAKFDVRIAPRAEHESSPIEHPNVRAALEADRAIFGELGLDKIEFLLSANPGEPLARLRDVASGGETARIMLALRSVLASAGAGRTLVFDEIDAGVGGRLGPEVAAHLKKLGVHHQVLCVTHLPAIAAAADKHLRASKTVHAGRTRTVVDELSGDARIDEIADMIAGGAAHETARAEARRLISAK